MGMLQIILIAVIFIIIVGAAILFLMNQEAERKKRVLSVIQGNSRVGKSASQAAQDDKDKRRAEIAKKLKESKDGEQDGKKKDKPTLSIMLQRAGLNISVKQYFLFSFGSCLGLLFLAFVTGQSPFVMVMAAVIGFFGLPRYVIKKKTAKRQKKFLEEFPDALEATVRLLKAGMPVSEAIMMCSKEFGGPVGEEMSRIYDKQKIGVPMHEAAFEATERMPLSEMQMFATGLAIQAQTGASLSEVLMNLSGVIRARFKLKRKIKALSSEAIASASIIGALPNLVGMGMYFANKEYIMLLFTTTIGNFLLAGAVVWMGIGIFVMRAMIDFKI